MENTNFTTYEQVREYIESKVKEREIIVNSRNCIINEIKNEIELKEKELDEKKQAKNASYNNEKLFIQMVKEVDQIENELKTLKEKLADQTDKANEPLNIMSSDEYYAITNNLRTIASERHKEYKKEMFTLLEQIKAINEESKKECEKFNELERMKEPLCNDKRTLTPTHDFSDPLTWYYEARRYLEP